MTSGRDAGFLSGTFCVANHASSDSGYASGGGCGGAVNVTGGVSGSSYGLGCVTGASGCESGGREDCVTGEDEGCGWCAALGYETAYGGFWTFV